MSDPFVTWPLAWRFAWRELRAGLKGFRIFLACLTLGVATIAGVGSLSTALISGLKDNARTLLGGDAEVRISSRDISAAQHRYLAVHSRQLTQVRHMRAMLGTTAPGAAGSGRRTLVEVKAVSPGAAGYPLYGQLQLEPAQSLAEALAQRDGVPGAAVEVTLLRRLGAKLGDVVHLGARRLRLNATIVREPDRVAGSFALGPRLMLSNQALDQSGLVKPGSLVRYMYRLRLAPETDLKAWRKGLGRAFPEAAWRVYLFGDAQPSVRRFVDRLGIFLSLVGLTALNIGGIGVGNTVQSYLAGKSETIATLKCLGAGSGLIFRIFLLEVGALALLGVLAGVLLGALVPYGVVAALGESLPVPARLTFYAGPLALAASFGVLTALAFALWPLSKAREVPAASLFRSLVTPLGRLPRRRDLLALALAVATLITLALLNGQHVIFSRAFIAGTVLALAAFWLLARLLVATLRRLPRPSRPALRLALANLTRPGAPTPSIVVSLGAGLTVLIAVALVEGNLARQVAERIPERAPAFFFIDIQPDQVAPLEAAIAELPGAELLQRLPTLRGRLAGIGGVAVAEAKIDPQAEWFTQGERGFTYLAKMPADTELTAGKWWPEDYAGPPLISLGARIAEGIGVGVGERLSFNVLGRRITAEIANLRTIDWSRMRLDFVVIFAPGTLEGAPQVHVASASALPAREEALYKSITQRFPNISAVRVRNVLKTVTQLFERIVAATRVMAVVTLAAGLLVLAGAVAVGQRRRLHEAVILKVLGATRRDVLSAQVLEFAILGLVTALVAALIGSVAAWSMVTVVMAGEWVFTPLAVVLTAAGGLAVTVAFGLIGTWRTLGQRPAPVLREL